MEDLGRYDERPAQTIESLPKELFPREIPEDVEDVQYRYRYAYASDDELYIAISWQCGDAGELRKIQPDLEQYGEWSINSEDEWVLHCDGSRDGIYLNVTVILNLDQSRVYYVAEEQYRPLPEKSEEILLGAGRSESPFVYVPTETGK